MTAAAPVCQCERAAHFGEDLKPGHPEHAYGAEVETIITVRTIYGPFRMCEPCANAVPIEYLVPAGGAK